MLIQDLKHGDVLLYESRKHQSFFVKGIRLITGSKFTHASVVQEVGVGELVVLEQLQVRLHSLLQFYYAEEGEVIHVFRPKFTPPEFKKNLFEHRPYGYKSILDCLLNHFLGLIPSWKAKPMINKNGQNIDCSVLVAKVLELDKNTNWCVYPEVVEPDDYANHSEFEYLGQMEW